MVLMSLMLYDCFLWEHHHKPITFGFGNKTAGFLLGPTLIQSLRVTPRHTVAPKWNNSAECIKCIVIGSSTFFKYLLPPQILWHADRASQISFDLRYLIEIATNGATQVLVEGFVRFPSAARSVNRKNPDQPSQSNSAVESQWAPRAE